MARTGYGLLLMVLVLYIASHAHTQDETSGARGEQDVTGTTGDQTDHRLKLKAVCDHSVSAFLHDAQPLSEGKRLLERYEEFFTQSRQNYRTVKQFFFRKSVQTPSTSMCIGLNRTCCSLHAEKALPRVVSKEHREIYHTVLKDEYFLTCPSIGRESYHSMRRSLAEAKRLLSIGVIEALNGTSLDGVFDDLFDYFTQFSITPDLCPLHWKVRQAVERILLTTLLKRGLAIDGDSEFNLSDIDSDYLACLKNISRPYIADFSDEISSSIHKLLWDYRAHVKSINLARKIVSVVRNHRFSPACVTALTRMKHCAYCGGYVNFPPCLNLCLNTVRGCFADVSELYDDFSAFVTALHKLSKDIDSSLDPESLIANQLVKFVEMISKVTKEESLKYTVARECTPAETVTREEETTSDYTTQKRTRRSRFSQPISSEVEEQSGTSFNPNTDLSDNSVSKAFSYEMNCLGTLQELLVAIPQEMCYLSKSHAITHALNTQCWTGTGLGDYKEPLIGLSKAEQVNNTVFIVQPIETDLQYTAIMLELQSMTEEINHVLEFRKMCVDSDDEDCIGRTYDECETLYSGSGSGSASGSGSGSGSGDPSSGMSDLEGISHKTNIKTKEDDTGSKINEPSSPDSTKSTSSSTSNTDIPTDETLGTIGIVEIIHKNDTEGTATTTTTTTTTTTEPEETKPDTTTQAILEGDPSSAHFTVPVIYSLIVCQLLTLFTVYIVIQ